MPKFDDPIMAALACEHAGLRPWSAGSHFEGVVSSIVGQSISVAAAAATEQRLYECFNRCCRRRTPILAAAAAGATGVQQRRGCPKSGVTTKRSEALVAVATLFASEHRSAEFDANRVAATERLASISGIGPWTVQSALLWGVAAPDAHPTRDVALLRAARAHYPEISDLKDSTEWQSDGNRTEAGLRDCSGWTFSIRPCQRSNQDFPYTTYP